MNKEEKKQSIEWFYVGAFIVIFFAALFFAFSIYDYGVENQGISLDYHFDNIVEGDYFSFSIFARDGMSYDWDNYEIVFDGFTAEEYVYESKYDDYKSFFFSNITDTGGEKTKTITFILNENHEDSPIELTISFNLRSKMWLFRRSLFKATVLFGGLIVFAGIRYRYKLIRELTFALYTLLSLSIFTDFIQENLRLNSSTVVYIVLCCCFLLFLFSCILCAKRVFGLMGYTILTIFSSTYLLYQLSYFFSYYYDLSYSLSSDIVWYDTYSPIYISFGSDEYSLFEGFIYRRLWMVKENIKYGLYSFRYFFSFPDDDIYGLASVFQFMLGKMYDLVVFGSVANCIIKASKPRIHKKQMKGEEK